MRRRPRRVVRQADPFAELEASPDGFRVWMARHLEWKRVKNYSEEAIAKSTPWLLAFALWCEARGITKPYEVTRDHCERYQRHLFYHRKKDGRPLAIGTQLLRLAPLRSFFAWMVRQDALLSSPAAELELPRGEERMVRCVLTAEEVERVLAEIDVADPLGIRDRAIVETLYATGLRRSEIVHLKLSDLDGQRMVVLVRRGKGKKDRMVPIGERAMLWIEKYLFEVRPHLTVDESEDALFVNHFGEAMGIGYLSTRIRRYVLGAKLGKVGACHIFRHSMATLMLEGGADVRFIQEMLGHAHLKTTEIYTHVGMRSLREVYERTHPAARLKRPAPAADQAEAEVADEKEAPR